MGKEVRAQTKKNDRFSMEDNIYLTQITKGSLRVSLKLIECTRKIVNECI